MKLTHVLSVVFICVYIVLLVRSRVMSLHEHKTRSRPTTRSLKDEAKLEMSDAEDVESMQVQIVAEKLRRIGLFYTRSKTKYTLMIMG